jgi:hypothetical protein
MVKLNDWPLVGEAINREYSVSFSSLSGIPEKNVSGRWLLTRKNIIKVIININPNNIYGILSSKKICLL